MAPRILIAEDDASMRGFLCGALQKAGYEVISSEDGLQALSILQDSKKGFDLLLTDIVMPGMDGIELARKAAELKPNLKIMFITGFSAVALDKQKQEPTRTRVLSKPFHLKELVTQVDEILSAA
jgi:two-component system cell cycle response regulator CpdR